MTDEEIEELENEEILKQLRAGEAEDDNIYEFNPDQKQETPYWRLTKEQEARNQKVGGVLLGLTILVSSLISVYMSFKEH